MSAQLALETSGPAPATPPAGDLTSLDHAGPEDLTYPADRETAEWWAANWRRRGFDVELARRGRRWAVVER